jgi:hypothetical protein
MGDIKKERKNKSGVHFAYNDCACFEIKKSKSIEK